MSSSNTALWDELNNRLRTAINATAGLPAIKRFTRGYRFGMLDSNDLPAIYTHWGPSEDKVLDTVYSIDSFDFSFALVIEIDDSEQSDYINSIVNLRDKILNAFENNSSGTQDRAINNKLTSRFEISSDEIGVSDSNKTAIIKTRIRVDSAPYQPGAR